jgi:hypothetical protein
MLARDRKPEATVVTNLRIRKELHRILEREAEQHQLSLNKEMINRLEDTLEAGDKLRLSGISADMETVWLRFSERFLERELEEGILTALEQNDFETAKRRAIALRKAQEEAARRRTAKMEGNRQ